MTNLNSLVAQIEKQSPSLSVLAARQFCYQLLQTSIDVTISEPRKFNILEEFILRASIEFMPPPTVKELADILGLDVVFLQSTAANLESLDSLEILSTGAIKITPQGREFYKRGTVSLPPQSKRIYAISDPLKANLTFQFSPLSEVMVDLPNLAELISIENTDIDCLSIAELEQLIQTSDLGLHVPENGKLVTSFNVSGKSQTCWQTISIFVLFDVIEDKYTIQVRQGKKILEKPSNLLNELESQKKVSLNDLCQLTEEMIASQRQAILAKKNQEVEAPKQSKSASQTKTQKPKSQRQRKK